MKIVTLTKPKVALHIDQWTDNGQVTDWTFYNFSVPDQHLPNLLTDHALLISKITFGDYERKSRRTLSSIFFQPYAIVSIYTII